MRSHLLDYDFLSKATYDGLEGEALAKRAKPDFETFLRDRAYLVHTAVTALASGKQIGLGSLQAMSKVAATCGPSALPLPRNDGWLVFRISRHLICAIELSRRRQEGRCMIIFGRAIGMRVVFKPSTIHCGARASRAFNIKKSIQYP
jgi:hypothetical protein